MILQVGERIRAESEDTGAPHRAITEWVDTFIILVSERHREPSEKDWGNIYKKSV